MAKRKVEKITIVCADCKAPIAEKNVGKLCAKCGSRWKMKI